MKAIIIGAGRGSRLMPTTADTPKCFAKVGPRRILDWTVDALTAGGVEQIAFIGGYQIEKVRGEYPQFSFYHNDQWQTNNILASLMHAEAEMDDEFICCYSDILFTPEVVRDLLAHDADISLAVDTDWLPRYANRTEHPADDAEKVTVANGLVTEVGRRVQQQQTHGEYIGVAKFSRTGARALCEHYAKVCARCGEDAFREGKTVRQAYLVHLFQDMIEQGVEFAHVDTHGGYIEIDTQQDFDYAREHWS